MPAELVSKLLFDPKYGIPFIEDRRGTLTVVDWRMGGINSPRFYLKSIVKGYTWPSITDFNSIPNSFNPGHNLTYTATEKSKTFLAAVLAAQSVSNKQNELSVLGLTINNGPIITIAPFLNEIHYVVYEPTPVPAGSTIELKFYPFNKKTDLAVNVIGYVLPIAE